MNIQFPLAGLLTQQEKTSSGTAAEGQNGVAFADILGQATSEQTLAALTAAQAQAQAAVPHDGELPGLSFQQSLHLSSEMKDEIESQLLAPELLKPELAESDESQLLAPELLKPELAESELGEADEEVVRIAEAPLNASVPEEPAFSTLPLANPQVGSAIEGNAAVATTALSSEQVTPAQRVASDQAQLQQVAASPAPVQALSHAKAPAVEAGFNLRPEQLDVSAKPVTPNVAESAALASNNNLQQATTPAEVRAALNAPMASPQWQNDLSQQVSSFVMRGDNRVSLQLNPAELGPLLVELKVVEQNAQLQFVSGQAAVRSAVEQAIPQLRDALAQQGIDLGDVNVGEQGTQQEQAQFIDSGLVANAAEAEADEGDLIEAELNTASATVPGQLSVYA